MCELLNPKEAKSRLTSLPELIMIFQNQALDLKKEKLQTIQNIYSSQALLMGGCYTVILYIV